MVRYIVIGAEAPASCGLGPGSPGPAGFGCGQRSDRLRGWSPGDPAHGTLPGADRLAHGLMGIKDSQGQENQGGEVHGSGLNDPQSITPKVPSNGP